MSVRLYCLRGWYYEHVYHDGKMVKRSLRTKDKMRAEQLVMSHQRMLDDSVLGGNLRALIESLNVPCFRAGKNGDFAQLKQEVIVRYQKALLRFKEFCHKRNIKYVYQVDKKVIGEYIRSMQGRYSDGTIRGQMMSLSSIWRGNGLQSVFTKENITLRVVEAKRSNISEDDIEVILKRSERNDKADVYGVLLLGARLGLRLGDICMLRKDEVKRGRIEKHLRKTHVFISLKLPKDVCLFLEKRLSRSDYIFPRLANLYLSGKRWQISRWCNQAIERVIHNRIEVIAGRQRGASRYSFHSLRHSFIVRLLEADVKPHVVKELAGVSVSLIMTRYGDHVKQSDKDHAMKLIDN